MHKDSPHARAHVLLPRAHERHGTACLNEAQLGHCLEQPRGQYPVPPASEAPADPTPGAVLSADALEARPDGRCEDWGALCPGKALAVIDTPDVDDVLHSRLCPTLWRDCAEETPTVLRVIGAPGVFARPRMARCRTLSVPWLSHARSALAALQPRQRTVHVAFAAGVNGHAAARKLGFQRWRKLLRDACTGLQNASQCTRMFQSLNDSTTRFCLQPPGDTVPRAGIVDALSVGCVPVLFHPAQQALWPRHWNASKASLLFDWSVKQGNASDVLQTLLEMPAERVEALHRAAVDAAETMYYRGELGDPNQTDAIDVLVRSLTESKHRSDALKFNMLGSVG